MNANFPPPADSAAERPYLEIRAVSKRYGAFPALRDVSVSVRQGSVHALVGENGAGKSTLGKIIAGVVRPDAGEILLDGQRVSFRGPRDALAAGVTIIAQELALLPARSVMDNVFLGVESTRAGVLQSARLAQRYRELADRIGFDLPGTAPVRSLRLADQQKVEIMRAVARGASVIVMDEPTAALTEDETAQLASIVRELAAAGTTILFISHFLDEVLRLCDTVTVLKDGSLVRTSPADVETPETLVTGMLGRTLDVAFPERPPRRPDAPVSLRVEGLSEPGVLHDISFSLREGEILGLAGLVGSGRSEVAHAIFGARKRSSGTIEVNGRRVTIGSPRAAVGAGLAMLPESRKEQGLVMGRPIRENVMLSHLGIASRGGVIARRDEQRAAQTMVEELGVSLRSLEAPVRTLSGGNQQKVLFAKWLIRPPRVLIADEPTRGVDVGAKRAIYELLASLAADGMSILLISSEVEEVLGLSDRVLVMRQGAVVEELEGDRMTADVVMRAAFAAAGEMEAHA
jgi:simple sugar transport system ATP-binding protein/ribose transport system ATP-binding protein